MSAAVFKPFVAAIDFDATENGRSFVSKVAQLLNTKDLARISTPQSPLKPGTEQWLPRRRQPTNAHLLQDQPSGLVVHGLAPTT